MLVEDADAVRIVLRMQLTILGYRVLEARNGLEAVSLGRLEHPDLILMDIGMPVLDGLEATRLLSSSPETRDIPVVALTAYTAEECREQAVSAGCRDFASKPIEMRELGELVARHISRGGRNYPRPV